MRRNSTLKSTRGPLQEAEAWRTSVLQKTAIFTRKRKKFETDTEKRGRHTGGFKEVGAVCILKGTREG